MTNSTEVEAAGNAGMVSNDASPSKNTFVVGAAEEEEVRDCVIIGGGIAGLAAAADLEEVGMDFVLLEAGDRLGGRIFTHRGADQSTGAPPLELGAQWLHGTAGNPLFDFCQREGIFESGGGNLRTRDTGDLFGGGGFEARAPDGTRIDRRIFRRHCKAWLQAVSDAEEKALTATQYAPKSPPPPRGEVSPAWSKPVNGGGGESSPEAETIGDFLFRRVREILSLSQARDGVRLTGGAVTRSDGFDVLDEGILGYLERLQCSIEGCDDLEHVSFYHYAMYKELNSGEVNVPGGFSRIVDALAAKIIPERIRLTSPVSMVRWDEEAVESAGALAHGAGGVGQQYPQHSTENNRGGGVAQSSANSSGANESGSNGNLAREKPTVDGESFPCVVEYRNTQKGLVDRGSEDGQEERVCSRRIRCKHVLVTVGLGVLKDGTTLAFTPRLPEAKLTAIRRLGFGTADKIFVRCTRRADSQSSAAKTGEVAKTGPHPLRIGVMRPLKPTGIQTEPRTDEHGVQQPQEEQGHVVQHDWVNGIYSFGSQGDHIYSWLSGHYARASETVQPDEIVDKYLALLRTVTKDSSWQPASEGPLKTPDRAVGDGETGDDLGVGARTGAGAADTFPRTLLRSTWNSNPFFRGSYSYIATGSSPADVQELARPLLVSRSGNSTTFGGEVAKDGTAGDRAEGMVGSGRPRVMFAGEATHPEFFSTAHGGFETGRRAAREILVSCGRVSLPSVTVSKGAGELELNKMGGVKE